MTEPDRNLTDADVDALADALADKSRSGRLERARSSMSGLIRSDAAAKKARTNARVLGRMNQPPPTDDDD
jgi:hypothetical protein